MEQVEILYGRVRGGTVIDGYCMHCKKDSTFVLGTLHIAGGDPWNNVQTRTALEDGLSLKCTRAGHSYRYNLLIDRMTVRKVGQYPSLADIAIDETRQKYRTVLRGENWGELYKAIGLAAHGEGIGSFVYLRRVFERLVQSRFAEFKDIEGWSEDDFKSMRMVERIELLKDHLPSYLVEARKIYGIFSQGIHELDNETCLQFFNVGKRSIIMILDDDLKKQQELASRKELADAVAKFAPEPKTGE